MAVNQDCFVGKKRNETALPWNMQASCKFPNLFSIMDISYGAPSSKLHKHLSTCMLVLTFFLRPTWQHKPETRAPQLPRTQMWGWVWLLSTDFYLCQHTQMGCGASWRITAEIAPSSWRLTRMLSYKEKPPSVLLLDSWTYILNMQIVFYVVYNLGQ